VFRRRHPIDAYRSVTILVLRGRRAKQAPDSSTLGVDVASKCRAPAPLVYRRFSCRHRNVCTFFCPDTHVSKYLSGDTPFGRRCRWLHWVLCRNMLNRSANEFSSTRPSHKNKIAMKAKIHTATMMWRSQIRAHTYTPTYKHKHAAEAMHSKVTCLLIQVRSSTVALVVTPPMRKNKTATMTDTAKVTYALPGRGQKLLLEC
jgi:hypothetical protein